MIKELESTKLPKWDEEIKLCLTLRDLQIIYNCVGDVPFSVLKDEHRTSIFRDQLTEENGADKIRLLDDIYENLREIIERHGGVLD